MKSQIIWSKVDVSKHDLAKLERYDYIMSHPIPVPTKERQAELFELETYLRENNLLKPEYYNQD